MENILKRVSQIVFIAVVSIILYSILNEDNPIDVVSGNSSQKPIPFIVEKTNDTICKMLIRSYKGSCQAITKDGDTYFFNDIGCMMIWLKEQAHKNKIKLWVYTSDTNRWIDAKLAHYTTQDRTVVGYGFSAYEKKLKNSIDFNEMRERMNKDEHLLNPKVRKRLLENRY
jgi:hypothetical protein